MSWKIIIYLKDKVEHEVGYDEVDQHPTVVFQHFTHVVVALCFSYSNLSLFFSVSQITATQLRPACLAAYMAASARLSTEATSSS